MRLSPAVLALAACLGTATAHAYDLSADWQTLQTPHFTLHFPRDQAHLAQKTAVIAERVHDELAPRMDWKPATRTEVVLADESDMANGSAGPLPYNQIHLIVSPPEPGDFMSVSDETEWLYQVFRHEYVHVLHLDAASGLPGHLRRVFGRNWFSFPNMLQPRWVVEGLATDMETDAQRGTGRGADSDMPMYMRTEVLSGVKPLAQVDMGSVMQAWPRGYGSYVYGLHFFQFLRERYGEKAALRMNRSYRGNLLPFRMDNVARRTTGKPSMKALWAEFGSWLEQRYQPQIDSIRAAGVQEGELVTHGPNIAGEASVRATVDGSVYYVRATLDAPPALMQRTPAGSEQRLTGVHSDARFDVHPSAGIVIAQLEYCRNDRLYYDLYLLAPGSSHPARLTQCARYRNVVWRPDGKAVYAVHESSGRSRIDELDLQGLVLQTLWTAGEDERVTQLALSPDGSTVVFVRSQAGQGSDLVALDVASRTLRPLTHDRNDETRPSFTPDGKGVLFSSNHGGVSNLRRLDLATGRVTTLTNTLTGAFVPSQGRSDGPIWFSRFGSDGYNIARLDTPLSTDLPPARPADPAPIQVSSAASLPARPYSPWPTMAPRSWFPSIGADQARTIIGFTTGGGDVLGTHAWQLALARDVRTDNWLGGLLWNYRDRVLLSVGRTEKAWLDQNDKAALVRSVDTAAAAIQLPFLGVSRQLYTTAGLVWEREHDTWRADGVPEGPDQYDGVAGVALTLNTSWTVPDAAGPIGGRFVRLQWETSNALGRSDYHGHTAGGEWREYFNLGSGRVLAGRVALARGSSGIQPYALGGSLNDGALTLGAVPFNQRDIDLRSYADGTLTGHAYQLGTLEYRTPLLTVDRTWTAPPIGLARLHGTVFVEGARTLQNEWSDWYGGVGSELVGRVLIGYLIPLDVRLGLAWGLHDEADEGGARVYLSTSYAF